ncbi:MAG TPA: diguanylate cyclase [Thermoanaerobaculia bacterium]|nr:diguanylate cyclase [Thermoanaerobaculia bacterium]
MRRALLASLLVTSFFAAHAQQERATEIQKLIATGYAHYFRGEMAEALADLQTAYRMSELAGDEKARLECLENIANVYADSKVAQYDKAIEYYKQLLAAHEARGERADVGDTLFNLGVTYETKGNLAASEDYLRRALALFGELQKPEDVALSQRALASCLMKQGRANAALPLLNEALVYFESKRDAEGIAYVLQFRGMAERRLGRNAEALRDLDAARRHYEGEKNIRFVERNWEETALVRAAMNDWRGAYDAQARHAALQEQLAGARRDELSSRLRIEFDTEKKEQENRALGRERKWQLAAIALTALLAAALAVLFWRQVAHTRRMRAMAMTDELTRLPNRRHILARAEDAFREGNIAVIAFDIDHFKRINDTWGHAAGDLVLQTIARTCRLTLRPSDDIGRTGGEEFLIVLRDTTAAQAADVAERLRTAVEQLEIPSIDRVTISLGVAARAQHASLAALVREADELLYQAKTSGRNRVASAA